MARTSLAELAHAQRRAVAMLASGASTSEVADAVQKSDRTIRRWLAEDTFRRELSTMQRVTWDCVARSLREHARNAVSVLVELTGKDQPPPQRLGAARELLGAAFRLVELDKLEGIEQRLDVLERGR